MMSSMTKITIGAVPMSTPPWFTGLLIYPHGYSLIAGSDLYETRVRCISRSEATVVA